MQNRTFTDQMGRQVNLSYPPERIISLVPSQTELLFDLGLQDKIVGLTKFCIHPGEQVRLKTKVGGTKKLDLELIRSLKPDLIIGNKEENEQEQLEILMAEFPVWMSDIKDLDDSLDMIADVGAITGQPEKAAGMARRIGEEFSLLSQQNRDTARRVAYFIWKNPYMAAGTDTFINNILNKAGWENAFTASRYPELEAAEIAAANPDIIFLSSEPYPFKEKHIAEFKAICPDASIRIVDGEMFSWYGSRLLHAPAYLQTLCADGG
ncbi:ABC transporter substrate-binding protein [Flavihumibacter sp. R14]|nr:ABC transporter substrate-binding protein [Flavihumibacter soli]